MMLLLLRELMFSESLSSSSHFLWREFIRERPLPRLAEEDVRKEGISCIVSAAVLLAVFLNAGIEGRQKQQRVQSARARVRGFVEVDWTRRHYLVPSGVPLSVVSCLFVDILGATTERQTCFHAIDGVC